MATRVAYLETEAILPGRESWASVSATLLRGRRPERPDCLEPHGHGSHGTGKPAREVHKPHDRRRTPQRHTRHGEHAT